MRHFNLKFLTFFLTALLAFGVGWAGEVTDVITAEGIGVNSTTYTNWSDKSFTSDAVYAGMTARKTSSNKYYIQINKGSTTNGYGLVSTTSGGKIKSITITINKDITDGGRYIDVYGNNSAYTASTQLYNSTTWGTKIGEANTNNASTTITPTDDYEYIGIRARSNAVYITDITIVWETEGGDTPTVSSLTVNKTSLTIGEAGDSFTVTGSNLVDDIGVTTTNGFVASPTTISNNGGSATGTINVTYGGRALYAQGTVVMGTDKDATTQDDTEATVTVKYQPEQYYIVGNFGGGWVFNDGSRPMEYANNVYSATITATTTSYFIFARTDNSIYNWNTDRKFFGAVTDGRNWVYNNDATDAIDLNGIKNYGEDNNVQYHCIEIPAGEYLVTINPSSNEFTITKISNDPVVYNKVTDASQLQAGKKYILVNEGNKKYLGKITATTGSTPVNIGSAVDGPTISENSVDIRQYPGIRELTLSGNEDGWSFDNGDGYLKWENGNTLDTESTVTNNSKWTVSYCNDSNKGKGYILTNVADDTRVLQYNSSSPRFACYTSAQKSAVLYVEDGVVPVLPAVAEPVISPNGGSFAASQEVTITCETSGATIRYTTDDTDPTATTGTVYDQPFTLNATTTVKAIAVLGEETSQVVSATFTKTGIETIAAANDLQNNTPFTFIGDAVVTFHRSNHLFVRDETGSGLIYGVSADDHQYNNGDVLKPEWKATYKLYESSGYTTPEFINPSGVEFKKNNGPAAPEMLSTLATTDVNKYVGFNNVTVVSQDRDNKNYYITVGESEICLRAAYEELVPSLVVGKTYNVTGVVAVYNDNPQLNLISATIVKEDLTLGFNPASVSLYVGQDFTAPALTGVPEGETIDVTYSSNNTNVATVVDNVVTLIEGATGTATITATFAGNDYYNEARATYTITVKAKEAAGLSFGEEPVTVNATYGDTEFTEPKLTNDADLDVTYATSDDKVAIVDPKTGEVTIVGAGTATITATTEGDASHAGGSASYTIVVAKADAGLSFSASTANAVVGSDFTAPTLNNPNGLTVTYTSSNPEVATVGENGNVTIVGEGTTTITAKITGNPNYEDAEVSYELTVAPQPVVAAPTFSLVAGTYGKAQQLTITAENGANILYSTDGSEPTTPYNGAIDLGQGTTTVKAVATKDGFAKSPVVTATYIIDIPEELPTITPFKGYYQIKNNGNKMYANIAGRKTLNFTDAENAKKMAGTVIWLETNDKGQVQSIRSQAADLQGYANRAMRYVPQMVDIVVNKINEMEGIEDATGASSVLGETGLDAIMEKFNECFDYHLYVEEAQGGWRLYGKTPNMQHVVDFYRDHKDQVEAKLPKLEKFINDALHKLINKIGGSTVFTDFSLRQIWENMGGNLPEPVVGDDAAIMDFYRAVLNNKNYVWDFAYQTAQIYWGNVKSHPRYEELKAQLGEYADYIDEFVTQVRPDFKYYVIQRGDEPDYISEGNGEIISNQPHTIWTLEPRTDFTVNIAGEQFGCPYAGGVGGYATTNYTDFAYTVPEGVTAYKVASVENGVANLQALSGVIPAQTPVLLMAKTAGDYVLKLSTEAGTKVTGNLLVGVDSLITRFQLKTPMVVSLFTLAQGVLGEQLYNQYVAQYEYLQLLYAGTVNNKYFWGLNSTDTEKCVYINENNEQDCVIRNLGNGEFVNDWAAPKTNKAFLLSETDQTITISTLKGDVNHDGYVNIADVTALIDRLLGDESHSCSYCSDVNSNNDVNIKDVTDLIDILLRSGADTHVDTPTPDPEGGDGN